MIGAPIRDREWILPNYLDALIGLNYPKELISFCFIINDCTDDSKEIATAFINKAKILGYRDAKLIHMNLGAKRDARDATRNEIYRSLSVLRNKLLSEIGESDYFFSVDSDIIVPPNALMELVNSKKDICSALIYNDLHFNSHNITWPNRYCNILIERDGQITHYLDYPQDSLFKVHTTGAVYLLSRNVCRDCYYEYHPQGEDVGFCIVAKNKGYEVWCNSSIFCDHKMIKE